MNWELRFKYGDKVIHLEGNDDCDMVFLAREEEHELELTELEKTQLRAYTSGLRWFAECLS